VGPKRAELLETIGVKSVGDLLYYFPRRYLDRSVITPIYQIKVNENTTVVGTVSAIQRIRGGRGKSRFIMTVSDETGSIQCIWFRGFHYIQKQFKKGDVVAFSQKVTFYHGFQMIHPDYDLLNKEGEGDFLHTGTIIPIYPSTERLKQGGLFGRGLRRIFKHATSQYISHVDEQLPQSIIERHKLIPLKSALKAIHFPQTIDELQSAKTRLIFDELFYLQLILARRKLDIQLVKKGIEFPIVGIRTNHLIDQLPFELTKSQKRVIKEIRSDMKVQISMNRLLQGDVGSGKTVVALITMLIAVDNGYQTCMMAPTEILAEQHFLTIKKMLTQIDVRLDLLVGGFSKSKSETLQLIHNGSTDIVIGTHAIIQDGVHFKNLGLVIVDEQHRFGVMQRATLRGKGLNPDLLVMTATPIPRSLSLTLYGDLDVSILDELPKGRKEISTKWVTDKKRDQIYQFIRRKIEERQQVYIVYPLVEESEKMDLKAATESYDKLSETIFPDLNVALIHGRMTTDEKEKVMQAFKDGTVDLLISTTVIEVGVDIPNASIIVIEHAERYGLTQLHQLRGRVGRGSNESYCILMTPHFNVSEDARKRLSIIVETIGKLD